VWEWRWETTSLLTWKGSDVKIVRAPLRVSIWGGGTDFPEYYKDYRAHFFSFAITQHMHVVYNPRPTGGYRVSYSEVEELNDLKDAKHTLIAELGKQYDLPPCTLTIISDVPKGTGLGSSSALALCLLKLVGVAADKPPLWQELVLAKSAFEFERAAGGKVGRQDHLPAAFGEFMEYRIDRRGTLKVLPHPLLGTMMQRYGMLFYTGITREANKILLSWEQQVERVQQIHEVAKRVSKMVDELGKMILPQEAAGFLRESWEIKRQIPGVMTPQLEDQYERIMGAGAMGAKLCGAGSGGCWFVMAELWNRDKVRGVLSDLIEIPFRVSVEGIREWVLDDGPELKI